MLRTISPLLLLACFALATGITVKNGGMSYMYFNRPAHLPTKGQPLPHHRPNNIEEIPRKKVCELHCKPFSILNRATCECEPCSNTPCQFGQQRNPKTCQCECPMRESCRPAQIFDEVICACRCPNIGKCSSAGQFFDLDTCSCECRLDCHLHQFLDPVRCVCIDIPTPPPTPPPTRPPTPKPTLNDPGCPANAKKRCNNRQVFIPSTCECACTLSDIHCNDLQKLNQDTCQCECELVLPAPEEVMDEESDSSTGTRSGTSKSGTSKSGTSKSGTSKSGTSKSGTSRSGTSQSTKSSKRGKRSPRKSRSRSRSSSSRSTSSGTTRSSSTRSETQFRFPSATRFCPAGQSLNSRTCKCQKW